MTPGCGADSEISYINNDRITSLRWKMQVNIHSVYDEGAIVGTSLIGAKGLSILIEVDGQRTLFDTGMRGRYLEHNLEILGVDPESIDRVVISHGQKDHVGGISGLLKNREAPVNVYSLVSSRGTGSLLGTNGLSIPSGFTNRARLIDLEGWEQLSENLFVTPALPYAGGEECFLVVYSSKGPIIISGCCHCGPEAVMDKVARKFDRDPRAFIGGVRLGKKEKKKAKAYADAFIARGRPELHLNHCTTEIGMTELRTHLGLSGVDNFYAGTTIEFGV